MNTLQEYLATGAVELGIDLQSTHIEKFSVLAAELRRWNSKINLTALTSDKDIAIKHFLDSITLVKELEVSGPVLDIGSGAGFPAIPLKIVSPQTEVVSVDAVEKKVLFQRHVGRVLGLEKFTAVHARVEALAEVYPQKFAMIVSRAFSDLVKFVQLSLPLLATDGSIIAMKGRGAVREIEAAAVALAGFGVSVMAVREFELPLINEARALVIIRKQ